MYVFIALKGTHFLFLLNQSTVSAETASVESPFQVAIVLERKKISARPYIHSDGDTERVGSGTPVTSTSLRQVPILVSND